MPILVDAPGTPLESGDPTVAILGDSGIVLGAVDEFGCRWHWDGDDPWSPSPAVRDKTGDRENGHGVWDASQHYTARNPQFRGIVRAPTHDALHQAKQRLFAAISVKPFELRIIEPTFDRAVMVRRAGEVLWSEGRKGRAATYSLSLLAPDPLIYSADPHTYFTEFPSTSGGLSWPTAWPVAWEADVTSGTVTVTNRGDQDAPLRARVTGSVYSFTILQPSTGRALIVGNPLGAILGAGEWLDIDTARRQVVLLDTAQRRSWARGQWITIPPGESELRVAASSHGAGAGVVFTNNDVWI